MDTKYRFLLFDYWIQTILGVAILACCVTVYGIYFGVLGLIPFGAVQVLSGMIFTMLYRDKKRLFYLLSIVVFFLLWYCSYAMSYDSYSEFIEVFNAILCIIPPTLGVWYYRLTRSDYKALKKQHEEVGYKDEEILDA